MMRPWMPVSSATSRSAACWGGLGTLEVALGQAPLDAARSIASRDQRRIGNSVTYVDDDAARAGSAESADESGPRAWKQTDAGVWEPRIGGQLNVQA